VRFAWFWTIKGSMRAAGRRSCRFPAKIGCAPQTLNEWVKKAEVDRGERTGVTTEMAERLKALERENRELRRPTRSCARRRRILPRRSSTADQVMIAFIEEHRGAIGVEPICKHCRLPHPRIYDHLAKRADP
jgi:transposase-like protein